MSALGIYAVAQHLKRLDPQGGKQHFAVRGDGHGVDLITGVDLFNQAQRAVVHPYVMRHKGWVGPQALAASKPVQAKPPILPLPNVRQRQVVERFVPGSGRHQHCGKQR